MIGCNSALVYANLSAAGRSASKKDFICVNLRKSASKKDKKAPCFRTAPLFFLKFYFEVYKIIMFIK